MIVWFSWIISICEIYGDYRTAGHLVFNNILTGSRAVCLQNEICLLAIFADQQNNNNNKIDPKIDPTFCSVFVCSPFQSFVVDVRINDRSRKNINARMKEN